MSTFENLEKWLVDNDKTKLNEWRSHMVKEAFIGGWQAATAESDKRIAELKANTSQIVQAVSRAADAREAGMENEIIALQAHINVLRNALEKLARLGNEPYYGNSIGNDIAKQALASTPAQSLQAHDNELLNKLRVRNWTDAMNVAWHKAIPDLHKAFDDLIEALKGK